MIRSPLAMPALCCIGPPRRCRHSGRPRWPRRDAAVSNCSGDLDGPGRGWNRCGRRSRPYLTRSVLAIGHSSVESRMGIRVARFPPAEPGRRRSSMAGLSIPMTGLAIQQGAAESPGLGWRLVSISPSSCSPRPPPWSSLTVSALASPVNRSEPRQHAVRLRLGPKSFTALPICHPSTIYRANGGRELEAPLSLDEPATSGKTSIRQPPV